MSSVRVILLLIIGLLLGCTSQNVWQTGTEISPVSYELPGETLDRTIGRLKRLAIIPGEFNAERSTTFDDVVNPPPNTKISAESLRSTFLSEAASFLSDERGYEVQFLDPLKFPDSDDATLGNRLENCSDLLVTWAKTANGDDASPPEIESCVKRAGQALNVDGLIVIGASQKFDHGWRVVLTVLTASLAWPTLMTQAQIEASAAIFEVSSGQIVWRSRFSKSASELTAGSVVVGLLLENIEHALPEVLIE